MIPSKKLTKTQAKQFVETVDEMSDAAFEDLVAKWKNNNNGSLKSLVARQ